VPAFRVKLGANDLNCVHVRLNPTHSFNIIINLWGFALTDALSQQNRLINKLIVIYAVDFQL